MKKKHIGFSILLVLLFYGVYSYRSKMDKDNWAEESPEIKYSKERIEEVWGGVLQGNNPALFYGTPLYDVADAMSGLIYFRNEEKITKLIDEIPKEYINYQEGNYGMTIGHFALLTNNMVAIRKLLDRGLNPNLMDKNGNAIIIDINGPAYAHLPESLETLKFMIKKGANVNLYSKRILVRTPLIRAVNSNFKNVRVLIAAGADPHFIDVSDNSPFESALSAALLNRDMEIINYLIFDQKVDFRTLKYPLDSKFHPGEYKILHLLREHAPDLNSKDYKEKMKLVAYLKTQGLDYWKTPIPDNIKNNPNFTQEYLSKY
ncbi:ankyrin repeat domain-containing protein [Flavobacterium cellulosilyticum]|uniref:Ankyrin repeat domain-containing protein n=1 Tax=Flavobacterium cellulosilyticum TaxID=2541731 RepID=A0A4R5CM30_9FLAO|nr:ankyrin repeat domain-containing protein [Flavobacterium cellulosilyticum]TDD98564.1 ankyrin repeat domain-containing protein [Flavobacterium cellulosilyticum]